MMSRRWFLLFFLCGSLFIHSSIAQVVFNKQSELLENNDAFFSGVAVVVTDINGDGHDDIARLQNARTLQLEIQGVSGKQFMQSLPILAAAQGQWNLVAGDVNNDDRMDFLTAGNNDGVKLLTANSFVIDDYDQSSFPGETFFAQGANFVDVDNDGFLDAFICNDDGISKLFLNDQTGSFEPSDTIDFSTDPPSDNSGNYGSIWSDIDSDGDLDLYIAKCRQGVSDMNDPRRVNQLFLNNGDGTYTERADSFHLAIGAQSWSADFGDYDNDGDFDCFITNHDLPTQLLENIDNAYFEDVSNAVGISVGGVPLQGVFGDFDNDGWLDILVGGTQSYIFHNLGNGQFDIVQNPFGGIPVHSFGVGDLNNDGFLDVYGMYQVLFNAPSSIRSDAVWINEGNDNNYLKVYLKGVESNRDGVGARLEIYGNWGIQTREVHAGESYGITNSLVQHFGLGSANLIDSLKIFWSSGQIDLLENPIANTTLVAQEGKCMTVQFDLGQSYVERCQDETLLINAPHGYDQYRWSTGEESQSIEINSEGIYHVSLTDQQGCLWIAGPVQVIDFDPTYQPQLDVIGDTLMCAGGSVLLTAPEAEQYLWNNGETTQSITVDASGGYQVTLTNSCGPITSETVNIEVVEALTPVVENDTIYEPGSAMLVAQGDSIYWFDEAVNGNLLDVGDVFQTPHLENTTVFYAENRAYKIGNTLSAGMPGHLGGSLYSADNFNGVLEFDVHTTFTLHSVEAFTEFYGMRRVILRDSTGAVLYSKDVDIQSDTTLIELGWEIAPGNAYGLTTDQTVNQNVFGVNSPKLYRSEDGVLYPYESPGVLTINTSSLGLQFYYYFYNWQIKMPDLECISERVPVTAVVDTSSAVFNPRLGDELKVSPNPAENFLWIELSEHVLRTSPQVHILDNNGKTVLDCWPMQRNAMIDLSSLPEGLYLLQLVAGETFYTEKVVIQR